MTGGYQLLNVVADRRAFGFQKLRTASSHVNVIPRRRVERSASEEGNTIFVQRFPRKRDCGRDREQEVEWRTTCQMDTV